MGRRIVDSMFWISGTREGGEGERGRGGGGEGEGGGGEWTTAAVYMCGELTHQSS